MKYIYLIAALLLSVSTYAQQEFTLHTLDHLSQSSYTNPAMNPRNNFSITLASSVHANFKNTGFNYNFLSSQINTNEDGQRVLDLGTLAENLNFRDNEFMHAGASVDLLALSFKAGKNRFSLNVTEHVQARLHYNDGLFNVLAQGNIPGSNAQIGNYRMNAIHYREAGIGFNRKLLEDNRLVVGGRVKVLFGMANVNTVRSDVNLRTGTEAEMYEITATSDILVQTSGINMIESGELDYLLNLDNRGVGVDLGATYEYSNALQLSASVINLGAIQWNEGVTNYVSHGEFTFRGIEGDGVLNGSLSVDPAEITDSLQNAFAFEETQESYRTMLPTQVYLSAFYRLGLTTTATGTLYSEFINGFRRGMVVGINQRAGRWFQASLTYAMHAHAYNNLGFGIVLGTNVQIYAVTDNLLAFTNPGGAKMVNIRGGFNFAF
jgi:hypothetical protein